MRFAFLIWLLAAAPLAATGTDTPTRDTPKPSAEAPPPPALAPADSRPTPATPEPETGLEPEITITTKGDTTYQEYRVRGKLYRVKVIPKNAPPYYLNYDEHGKVRRSDLEPSTVIPTWVIKSW